MPVPGFVNVSLKKAVVARIDEFLELNDRGFSKRPQLVTAAVHKFIDDYYAAKAEEIALRSRLRSAKPRAAASKARGQAK